MTGPRFAISAFVLLAFASAGSAVAGSPNLVTNGNFKAGNTGFTTGYTLTTMTPYLFQDGVHGIYAVEKAAKIAASSAYGDWTNISTTPSGKNGNVYVAASLAGKRGIVKITPQGKANLEVSGQGLVGLAFAPGKAAILATHSAVHHIAWNIQGRPLLPE